MKHVIIWIDQKEARVFDVDAAQVGGTIVEAPGLHVHRHANERDLRVRNHPEDATKFFGDVSAALKGSGEILLVGPSKTKLHFLRYVQEHDRALEARIVGIETADHPTNAELVAHLRHHFNESPPRRGP